MVKKGWVWAALAAGVVLGYFLTTFGAYLLGFSTAEGDGWNAKVAERRHAAPNHTAPAPVAATAQAAPAPAETAGRAPVASGAPPPELPPRTSPPPASVALVVENAPVDRHEYGDYNGYSLPVDAGPHFGAQIADSISNGRRDSLAIEHLQLEREVRDDSWSYPLEADLQYMLASDPVMGKFKVEHLECRATLCELRVSGRERLEPPSSAVNQWLRDMTRLSWPGGLTPGTVVFAGTADGSEGILMLRKPPPRN